MTTSPSWQIHRESERIQSAGRMLLAKAFDDFCSEQWDLKGPDVADTMEGAPDEGHCQEVTSSVAFMASLILDGTLDTWSRPIGGGAVSPIPAEHWEVDAIVPRFATSSYNATDWANANAEPTHWILVGVASFENFMNAWILGDYSDDPDFEVWEPEAVASIGTAPVVAVASAAAATPGRISETDPATPTSMPGGLDPDLAAMSADPPEFLRLPDLLKLVKVSRTTIYAWIEKGRFPKGRHLGGNTTVWRRDEIVAHLNKI